MTISPDGFVADQNGDVGRLDPDLAALRHTPLHAGRYRADEQTGAVLMGRRAFEMADPDSYVGNYEFQVPIFVLTHHPPSVAPKQDEHLTFMFVTGGVETAVAQATAGPAIRRFRWSAALIQPNSSWMGDLSTSFMLISCRYF